MRTAIGFLFALFLLMTFGCGPTFSNARSTCIGATDTHQEAIRLVVPHLAQAMTCAAENVDNDEAAIACVHAQFERLKAEVKPVVYACAIALVSDVVTAGK